MSHDELKNVMADLTLLPAVEQYTIKIFEKGGDFAVSVRTGSVTYRFRTAAEAVAFLRQRSEVWHGETPASLRAGM